METTFSVRIKMADGEIIELKKASSYSVNTEKRLAEVVINGFRQFFNLDFVVYIERVFDFEKEKV